MSEKERKEAVAKARQRETYSLGAYGQMAMDAVRDADSTGNAEVADRFIQRAIALALIAVVREMRMEPGR